VIIVADPDAAGRALAQRTLRCPRDECAGILRPWSKARARSVQTVGGDRVRVRPARGLCTVCGATEVLLPSWCLPRRGYAAAVVGQVLLGAERQEPVTAVAAAARVPVRTAQRWVQAVTRSATGLSAAAVQVAGAFADPEAGHPVWTSPTAPPAGPLTAALTALGGAARSWRTTGPSVIGRVGTVTGVNYLALVVQQWQQTMLRRLGVVDPTDVLGVQVTGWPLINVITGGRLLTTPG
jgi:hypothetical protein